MIGPRHQVSLRFLNANAAALPAGEVIDVIPDNHLSYRLPTVLRWRAGRRRFVFHFSPTFGSQVDAVITFFSALTGVGSSAAAATRSSTCGSQSTAASPRIAMIAPFIWISTLARILARSTVMNVLVR